MGIFDRFKKKATPPSPAEEDLRKAQEHFQAGNYQEALGALAGGFNKDVNYLALYALAAKSLGQLGATEEQALFENVCRDVENVAAFQELGTHFYQVGHMHLARPFLEKAVAMDGSNRDVNHDLALVYARRFQIAQAIETLEINPPEGDFWDYWFWSKLMVLDNRPLGIEAGLDQLLRVLDEEPDQAAVAEPRKKVMEVKEIMLRLAQFPQPETHIRDWHFVQYGGVILDFFEEPDQYVAGGRYVATWGSNEAIKEVCLKLKAYLDAFGLEFQGIRYLNHRSAKILGLVMGELLDLPAFPLVDAASTEECLVIGANSSDFDELTDLAEIREGQVLFSLNHNWLESAYVMPDIVGFMSQMYNFPWEGGSYRLVDEATGQTERTEPDTRPEEAIVAEILTQAPDLELNQDDLDFYLGQRDYLKAIGTATNLSRYNFMVESPVPGSYFGQ